MSNKYVIILQQIRTLPLIQNLIYSNGKHDSGHPFLEDLPPQNEHRV